MSERDRELVQAGARVLLEEVEAALAPLLARREDLQRILTGKARGPATKANGQWRMTKARRGNLVKAREAMAKKRMEENQVEAIMTRPLPEEPTLPW